MHDLVLNSLYGAVLLGVGLGLVYRGRGTSGGSDILGRILNDRLGISISQAYLVTDTHRDPGGGLRLHLGERAVRPGGDLRERAGGRRWFWKARASSARR